MTLPANAVGSGQPVRLRADEAAVLLEIAQAAGSTLNLSEVLDRIAEKTARLTGADRCHLWLLGTDPDVLLPAAYYGIDPAFTARWKRLPLGVEDERLSQEAILTGQPVIVEDAATDPRTDKQAVGFFGDKSILVVPMANKGRVVGTLFLNHISRHYRYSPQEVAVIQAIASQAAVAIENAQLYEESYRRRMELLASFRRIGDALAAGHDLTDTLRLVVELATEMLLASVGVLTLLPNNGTAADVQWAPADAPQRHRSLDRDLPALSSEVVARREPLYVADLAARYPGDPGAPADAARTFLGVPLRLRGEIIGSLAVSHVRPRQFSAQEIELLESFGAQAAIAIDNARLVSRLQLKVEELSAAATRNAELYTNLQSEKQRLDMIFRNSSDAIFMTDGSGQIVAYNPAATVLTGWPATEAVGQTCAEVFPGDPATPLTLHEATRQVLETGNARASVVESVVVNRAGQRRHVAASYAYVPSNNGEGPFALAVVRDVSQQKEVERLKSDFISMVSHELRTPLAVIKGYAATLLNPSLHLETDVQLRFLRGINDASDRLTRLIDNLLSVSRLESGRFRSNPQVIDLADAVRKVVANLRQSSGLVEIVAETPADGLRCVADRDQIEQVLMNLISNAIKYSPEGGRVTITLATREGDLPVAVPPGETTAPSPTRWALLTVKDEGIGIPPNQVHQIFDKFYRGDSPSVRRVAGTGLGLYICKGLVEAHHGQIWVESQLGQGSTFYVALPNS
jgi:PAS domain S-box-containing protein